MASVTTAQGSGQQSVRVQAAPVPNRDPKQPNPHLVAATVPDTFPYLNDWVDRTERQEPRTVVHLRQLHKNNLEVTGETLTPSQLRAAESQFNLAKYILQEVKRDPNVAIFGEDITAPVDVSKERVRINEGMCALMFESTKNQKGETCFLAPRLSTDKASSQIDAAYINLTKSLTKVDHINGTPQETIDLEKFGALVAQPLREALGLDGNPALAFEALDNRVKSRFYEGGLNVLTQIGAIETILPTISEEQLKEAFAALEKAMAKVLNNSGEGPVPSFEDTLKTDPELYDAVITSRERWLTENVEKYLQSPEGAAVKKVIIVYGQNHDLSDNFSPLAGIKFEQRDSLDSQKSRK